MSKILRSVVRSGKGLKQALCGNQVQSQRLVSSVLRSFDGKSILAINNRALAPMCSSFSTEVEGKLAAFLKEDIKVEKKHETKIGDKVGRFEVAKLDGPSVVLKKVMGKEGITIKFNVNHSLEELYPAHDEQAENVEPEIISRPSFVVELDKGGNTILAFNCRIVGHNDEEADQEAASGEFIEIEQATLLTKGQEWDDDKVYCVSGSFLDHDMDGLIKEMLEERGIDEEFVMDLEEWSTSYEHMKYIGYLEGMKDFVSK